MILEDKSKNKQKSLKNSLPKPTFDNFDWFWASPGGPKTTPNLPKAKKKPSKKKPKKQGLKQTP